MYAVTGRTGRKPTPLTLLRLRCSLIHAAVGRAHLSVRRYSWLHTLYPRDGRRGGRGARGALRGDRPPVRRTARRSAPGDAGRRGIGRILVCAPGVAGCRRIAPEFPGSERRGGG